MISLPLNGLVPARFEPSMLGQGTASGSDTAVAGIAGFVAPPPMSFEAALEQSHEQEQRIVPALSFDALGVFGRVGATSGGVADPSPVEPGRIEDLSAANRDFERSTAPARALLGLAGPAAAGLASPHAELPISVMPDPSPQSRAGGASTASPLPVQMSTIPISASAGGADKAPSLPAARRTQSEAPAWRRTELPVSAVANVENGVLQVIVRSGDAQPEARASLRRLLEELASEHGLAMGDVQLDGSALTDLSSSKGMPHGRRTG